ncbi:NHLP bacteriocin export ABC transporter permease/ATPase subunit [Legionella quateirensis]|nr:NHLP bacteriocin export ABC transporter permease/ATPase subunit [Legionella quateirensis]
MMDKNNDRIMDEAMAQIVSVFDLNEEAFTGKNEDELWIACQLVTQYLKIPLKKPDDISSEYTNHEMLRAIVKASGFRFRTTLLTGCWWDFDNGPMIVFEKDTDKPLALIPGKSGKYRFFNVQSGVYESITPDFIEGLSPRAYTFYRTLPDQKINLGRLFQFAMINQKADCFRILCMQILIGIFGLVVPVLTGIILDDAVPGANLSILSQSVFGIIAACFGIALFSLAQNFSALRVRFKMNSTVQPAVWDRLLRLPVSFFHRFSPGDLTLRAAGIDAMQEELTNTGLHALLGGIFSFITLILMFYYSPILASWSILLILMVVILITISNIVLLKYQRPIIELQAQLTELSFQYLTSISKLRISNSESRAFAIWINMFCKKSRLSLFLSLWELRFELIRGFFSVVIFIFLYAMIGSGMVTLSFGAFIAFNAAFGQFFSALLALSEVLSKSIELIPLYERIRPILQETPEMEGVVLKELTGTIQLKDISFQYKGAQTPVLNSISLCAEPGEFIAITGATGSGKSTVIRLLLGFETPTQGAIYFDGQNINTLNVRLLREQFGVVLQNGSLFPGTVFENIVAGSLCTVDDAWQAAKLAGFAKDIEAMPMGMLTLLTEGGKTLSVGQRQRLMIARALSRKPRILLLDEATSALDNTTQAEVMHHIEQLNITRIVVAHRLSTLINADRIYVVAEGKIVQTGNYQQLLREGGFFRQLVKKQML